MWSTLVAVLVVTCHTLGHVFNSVQMPVLRVLENPRGYMANPHSSEYEVADSTCAPFCTFIW
jgi:hypothetical protein